MSTTNNLGLFKHDNPSTNTDKFDIDKSLNKNWDKVDEESGEVRTRLDILETDNTTNKQDINELKAKTIKCLQEVETPTPVSGESIDISDSAEMRCELKISGNSVQDGEPTPDIPVEVKCCGDNINIFDGEVEEGNIDASTGQNTAATNAWRSKNYLNVKDTSVSISVKDLTFSDTVGRLYFYKSDNTYISNILINSLPFTATLPNETAKVRFFILNSVADINAKIKLEKGSTVTPYSPYGQGCINEVICNRNFINVFAQYSSGYSRTINGITFKVNEDGTVAVNGTSTSTSWTFFQIIRDITVGYNLNSFVDGNTYYLIGAPEGSTSSTYCLQFWDEKNTTFYDYGNGIAVKRIDSTRFNVAIGIAPGVTVNNVVFKPMLLKGDYTGKTLPEYEEHKEQTYTIPTQQPFRSIEIAKNTFLRDTFIKKNNKWYEHHPIVRIESYNGETITSEYISSTGELSTGATVDYISDMPTDIECTEEQSTVLWNIEQNAKTYKNITHIYSTDEVSANKEVTYKKDIETLFNKI